MVTEFGMSEALGPVRYAAPSMMYLNGAAQNREDIGEGTFNIIDSEIKRFVSEAQEKALSILREHEKVLHEAAQVLQDKEVISNDEIKAIIDKENSMNEQSQPE